MNDKQGAQYGAKCHLYDRPGWQLSWHTSLEHV